MNNPTKAGPTKLVLQAMGIEDPTTLGSDDLQAVFDRYNALPIDARRAITDPGMSNSPSTGVHLPAFGLYDFEVSDKDAAEFAAAIGPIVLPDTEAPRNRQT